MRWPLCTSDGSSFLSSWFRRPPRAAPSDACAGLVAALGHAIIRPSRLVELGVPRVQRTTELPGLYAAVGLATFLCTVRFDFVSPTCTLLPPGPILFLVGGGCFLVSVAVGSFLWRRSDEGHVRVQSVSATDLVALERHALTLVRRRLA